MAAKVQPRRSPLVGRPGLRHGAAAGPGPPATDPLRELGRESLSDGARREARDPGAPAAHAGVVPADRTLRGAHWVRTDQSAALLDSPVTPSDRWNVARLHGRCTLSASVPRRLVGDARSTDTEVGAPGPGWADGFALRGPTAGPALRPAAI